MKTKSGIFTLLLLCSVLNAQQWYVQSSPSAGNGLRAVYFVSQTTGWIGGANGIIMKTMDGGVNWTLQSLSTTSTILDIHFTDSQTGFLCCGNGKIFKTSNGGEDWVEKNSGGSYAMIGMYFRDATNGYAVGGPTIGKGVILRTSDGGETWSSYDGPTGNQLRTAHFFNDSYGLVAGADGYFFKTTNGGKDWHKVYHSSTGTVFKMFYTSANTAYAASGLAVLLKTTEKDTNWTETTITGVPEYTGANSLYFMSDSEGWVALDNGRIAHITNGGVNIEVQNTGTTNDLKDIFFYDASHGWAVGEAGVLLSTNPGSQSGNMTLVGQISNILSKGPFYVVDDKAYISMNNSDSHVYTLNIFDISNPASPALQGSVDFQCCIFGVYAAGNYVYVSGPENKLFIVDISDPANPVKKGSSGVLGLERLVVSGNYAYITSDGNEVWVVDVSNPDAPAYTGKYSTPGVAKDVAITGDTLFVACTNQGLRVVDVSDSTNPVEIGAYNTPGWALDVYSSGNYVYVGAMNEGLRVIDVSDPANPLETGSVSGLGLTMRVSGSGNYVYATAANVVTMINVSYPTQPHIVGSYETESGPSGAIEDILCIGEYIYVADRYSGFYILQNDLISSEDELSVPRLLDVTVFPNPAKDEFEIYSQELKTGGGRIELYNLTGRKLIEKYISKGAEECKIDVSALQSGVYICRIRIENGSVTKKLIIQK